LNKKTMSKREKTLRVERWLGVAAIAGLIIAWIIGGSLSTAGLQSYLEAAMPQADRFELVNGNTYQALQGDDNEQVIGYINVAEADGYGGPLTLAVAVDLEGRVIGMSIVDHKETPSYLARVVEKGIPESLMGKSYQDLFVFGNDVDAISGATYTVSALAEAAREASRVVAQDRLGLDVPIEESQKILFGIPEMTLVVLFTVGYIAHQRKFKYQKLFRWGSLLVGLLVLGFIYNRPLTLSHINQLLLGYFPDWHTNLYWYILLIGILFVFTVDNKNPYCDWFCPFGAAQECMGAIGNAKTRSVGRYKNFFKWALRAIVWAAIAIALVTRNPGITSYEIFGTLFSFTGSGIQFVLLGIVLVVALFFRRPWCTFLCPLKPFTDLYRLFRTWISEIWKKRIKTKKA